MNDELEKGVAEIEEYVASILIEAIIPDIVNLVNESDELSAEDFIELLRQHDLRLTTG